MLRTMPSARARGGALPPARGQACRRRGWHWRDIPRAEQVAELQGRGGAGAGGVDGVDDKDLTYGEFDLDFFCCLLDMCAPR